MTLMINVLKRIESSIMDDLILISTIVICFRLSLIPMSNNDTPVLEVTQCID